MIRPMPCSRRSGSEMRSPLLGRRPRISCRRVRTCSGTSPASSASTTPTHRRSRCSILEPARGRRRSSRLSTSIRICCRRSTRGRLRSRGSRPRSPRPQGSSPPPWSRSGAAMRWQRPSGRASSRPARSATWSERRNRSAPRAGSRARIRRCSWSVTRTRTPLSGCSRTPDSSPAGTCVGGGINSPRSNGTPNRSAWGMRTTSSHARPGTWSPARRAWCSSRACRARWRPSGTERRGGSSTGSRSRIRVIT